MNCVLSDSQMKLLSLVRQNGGEMDVMKLSSFQCRSIRPLIDAGFCDMSAADSALVVSTEKVSAKTGIATSCE